MATTIRKAAIIQLLPGDSSSISQSEFRTQRFFDPRLVSVLARNQPCDLKMDRLVGPLEVPELKQISHNVEWSHAVRTEYGSLVLLSVLYFHFEIVLRRSDCPALVSLEDGLD